MTTTTTRRPKTQTFEVEGLTRVEGEGSLRLVVEDGAFVEAHLGILDISSGWFAAGRRTRSSTSSRESAASARSPTR